MWERVTAGDIQRGDWIARTRNEDVTRVVGVDPGPTSVWVYFTRTHRIRPRKTTKLWRWVDDELDT
jgi:hypothetical protein